MTNLFLSVILLNILVVAFISMLANITHISSYFPQFTKFLFDYFAFIN